MGKWFLTAVSWLCAAVFIGVALYAYRRKTPVNFWSTSAVGGDEIGDITAYNRANAIMWGIYGLIFIVIGVIGSLAYVDIAVYLMLTAVFLGIPVLIFTYSRIYNRYKK